jgi:hypothetical protein
VLCPTGKTLMVMAKSTKGEGVGVEEVEIAE